MSYTYLKLQDKTLMAFDRENAEYKVYENDLLPFVLRDTVKDTTNLPDAEKYKVAIKNSEQLTKFFTERSLSINRENAKFILNELGISQKSDSETKEKMMIMCKALSAADDYWITENKEESWSDINVRENPLHETLAQIALFGKSLSVTGKIRTPELTGLGAYAKAWFRDNGTLYLYKAGTKGGNEAEREALTSRILDCFNVPQIEYELTQKEDKVVTKCKQMNNSMYSIADAGDVSSWCMKNDKDFLSLVKDIDSETFYKTIVADYLCSNRDRLDGNWGFFLNNMTGELICLHPLFDHNNCFDEDFIKDENGGNCQLLPGKTQKEAALYAIKHCDFRCIKPVTKDMFIDETMYKSFMKRAEELGLYRSQKLSLFDKITGIKEPYIPVEIKKDNRKEYWDGIIEVKSKQNERYRNEHIEQNDEKKVAKMPIHKSVSDDDGMSISD